MTNTTATWIRGALPFLLCAGVISAGTPDASAQQLAQGPFDRMVIRGVTVIDGTAGPPSGPMDIVVEAAPPASKQRAR